MIDTKDICYAEAFGDYTMVFTKSEDFLSTKGITHLLDKLNPDTFFRLHRSHFANINAILELKKIERYYYAILSNGKSLRISDTYFPIIKEIVL